MRIALDYDRTYTEDVDLWEEFILLAKARGHEVVCVTMRHSNGEEAIAMACSIVYTGRKAKRAFVEAMGMKIDIWIDDSPHWIFQDG